MFYNLVKWSAKIALMGVLWVYILSIRFEEKTLFTIFHSYLVKNTIVTELTEELTYLWQHTRTSSKSTISRVFDMDSSSPSATAETDDELDKG